MSKLEKVYHLHNILSQRRTPISRQVLMEELGCSQATFYRLLAELRDTLGAPVEQDPDSKHFYYDRSLAGNFELPGVWLSSAELQALLSAQEVLSRVQPGLLDEELGSLRHRIGSLLQDKGIDDETQARRVRIIHQASRLVPAEVFHPVLTALTQRQRLHMVYRARTRDEVTERDVSPQRLTNYRNNWYLDAWCHLRRGLRSFALERMEQIALLSDRAEDIEDGLLHDHFTAAYGIFSGPAEDEAVLRFSPVMARWVAEEQWHSRQSGQFLQDGRYELKLPFGHAEELILDIMKYGPEVEVVGPVSLRSAVHERLMQAAAQY